MAEFVFTEVYVTGNKSELNRLNELYENGTLTECLPENVTFDGFNYEDEQIHFHLEHLWDFDHSLTVGLIKEFPELEFYIYDASYYNHQYRTNDLEGKFFPGKYKIWCSIDWLEYDVDVEDQSAFEDTELNTDEELFAHASIYFNTKITSFEQLDEVMDKFYEEDIDFEYGYYEIKRFAFTIIDF